MCLSISHFYQAHIDTPLLLSPSRELPDLKYRSAVAQSRDFLFENEQFRIRISQASRGDWPICAGVLCIQSLYA